MYRCSTEKLNAPSRQPIKPGKKSINYQKTGVPYDVMRVIKNTAQKINKILIKTSIAVNMRDMTIPVNSMYKKPHGLIKELLLQKKFTDDEILSSVQKIYGTGSYMTKRHAINLIRSGINKGLIFVFDEFRNIGRVIIDKDGNRKMLPYKPRKCIRKIKNEKTI
jgi:hypothetical protein